MQRFWLGTNLQNLKEHTVMQCLPLHTCWTGLYLDRASLYSPGWLGTQQVDHDGLELTELQKPLLPEG